MTMPQEQVDLLLNPLLARLQAQPIASKNSADYWALRAAENFPLPGGHRDRGIFSVYLLNLVHLLPGQGTFQPAGVLHAYLEGVNVELMANSDTCCEEDSRLSTSMSRNCSRSSPSRAVHPMSSVESW